jgi:ketosteroid isomerase-like protein
MSEENVEIAQRFLQACASGDLDEALAHADPKIVWSPTQEGQAEGITAVRATMERWEESFEDLELTYEETIDVGDRVLLRTHVSGRGRGSGVEVNTRSYMLWTLQGSKVVRMDEFTDERKPRSRRTVGVGDVGGERRGGAAKHRIVEPPRPADAVVLLPLRCGS